MKNMHFKNSRNNSWFVLIFLMLNASLATSQVGAVIWEDNFDSLNLNIWNPNEGNGCEIGLCGWGNQELQYYHGNNVAIEEIPGESGNNALVLEAKRETIGTNEFTSGKVDSKNKLSIHYGLIEVRMRVPRVEVGLWPAAWLLGTSNVTWPANGEIDMMEMGHSTVERERLGFPGSDVNSYVGANAIFANEDGSAASIAYDVDYNAPYLASSSLADRFVTYRLYWEPTQMRFTIVDEGTEYDLYGGPLPIDPTGVTSVFSKPFYMLLNLAVGGNFTDALVGSQVSAPLPAKVYIDFVRVSEWNGYGTVTADYGGLVAESGPFGVFTENTPTTNAVTYGLDAQIFAWGASLQEGTTTAIEGSEVIAWETVTPNSWFGGGVSAIFGRDMSGYVADGTLKFKIKIPEDVSFRIGISDNFTNEAWVDFPAGQAQYGLTRDGEWGQVAIPLADFSGTLAFQNINYLFAIGNMEEDLPSTTFQVGIDDVVWDDGDGIGTGISATGVNVSPTNATINLGTTQQFTAQVSPANATNTAVNWSSVGVASVSSSGLVTGIATGSATITATTLDGGFTHSTTVTVIDGNTPIVSVSGLSISPTTTTLAVGATQQLATQVSPANATNTGVSWSSSNTSIASVNASGLVTANTAGSATITATSADGGFTATTTVTVTGGTTTVSVSGISISPTTATLAVGATQQLAAQVSPANATNTSVSWSSSDTGIATVNSSGLVTANAAGSATLTATSAEGGFTASTTVLVANATPGVIFIPDPSKTYYITNSYHELKIGANGTEDPFTAPISNTTDQVKWKFTASPTADYYYIDCVGGGQKPRLRSDRSDLTDMQRANAIGNWVRWSITPVEDNKYLLTTLGNTLNRLQINNYGIPKMVTASSTGTWEQFTITEAIDDTPTLATVQRIEAEDYVAMNGVQTETTTDVDGGLNVGYIDAGDWMDYTVTVPTAGSYTINFRVASEPGSAAAQVWVGGVVVTTVNIAPTGGWQSWITLSRTVNLSAGTQTIRLYSPAQNWNINWFEIENTGNGKATADEPLEDKVMLYPVPANEVLNISVTDHEEYLSFEIIDVTGKVMLQQQNINANTTTLNSNELAKGVYFLRATKMDASQTIHQFLK